MYSGSMNWMKISFRYFRLTVRLPQNLLHAHGLVDLIIPRGSQSLINFVRENSSIPVIETGAGICHTYFDEFGDVSKGKDIVYNAKTRRPSVCNTLDCLIVHENRLNDLPLLTELLPQSQVVIYADEKAYQMHLTVNIHRNCSNMLPKNRLEPNFYRIKWL